MKIFRDPLHNVIDLDTNDERTNRLIESLIDTPEFQRLKYIRQLGLTYFTFPGAQHTRFEHSLGAAHLAKKFVDKIAGLKSQRNSRLNQAIDQILEEKKLIVIASLLHDVGHGPFSHAFEGFTGFKHEQWTEMIVKSPHSRVYECLEQYESGFSEKVAQVIGKQYEKTAVVKLLSSQLDVDRIDYLLRDSLLTGAKYGNFDQEWMINVLRVGFVGKKGFEVGLDRGKGKSVAEDFIMARFYMYENVYLHKTTRFVEMLLNKILERAKEVLQQEGDHGLFVDAAMKRIMLSGGEMPDQYDSYIGLTDTDVVYHIKAWQHSADETLADLSSRFINRNSFKSISVHDVDVQKLGDVMEVYANHRLDMNYYFFEDQITASAYENPYISEGEVSNGIMLFDKAGSAEELSTVSNIIHAVTLKSSNFKARRWYVHPDLYVEINAIVNG